MPENPDSIPNFLFVALIVPDPQRHHSLAAAIAGSGQAIVREFGEQPGDLSAFARLGCDIAIVDLDHDIDQALHIIENICLRNPSTTVMASSARSDLALARRAMQAGARDYLAEPVCSETIRAAFDRISSRRGLQEKAPGKLLVFVPSKRGVGVTSVASNFAISLLRESGARVVIVDMDLQLGDVCLGLGLTASCSVVDALKHPARFDRDFLKSLLLHHNSGLDVLGSPEDYTFGIAPDRAAADKVFQVLLEEFDYVVVDSGTSSGQIQEALFEKADKLYLVTELSVPAIRNAHRIMLYLSVRNGFRNLEVILNRVDARKGEVGEDHLRKALGRPPDWKIPHGRAAAVHARNAGVPLAMENSPVSSALTQMAKAACGKPLSLARPNRLFGFLDPKTRTHHVAV